MKKIFRVFIFLFLFVAINSVHATHNRAGEILYQWIGTNPTDYTYRITIITYTQTSSSTADRPTLDSVYFGDEAPGGPPTVFVRSSKINLANDVSKNTYINQHTYVGNGVFNIHFSDPNRNADVVNIPHSVNVPFYLESILIISPFLGHNSSPILTAEPIDEGCKDRIFEHNPGAHDPDPNDSLSYELIECRGSNGSIIGGYSFPSASISFTLDSSTGDLIWNTPQAVGEYNIAFKIIQWRNGNYIGHVVRDMQIEIIGCDNRPPMVIAPNDTCILAGDTLSFVVTAEDPDTNIVVLSGIGGIFNSSIVADPATFTLFTPVTDSGEFVWQTKCHHVRPQPYFAQFKAVDVPTSSDPPLVDFKGINITVIAPAPPSATVTANGSAMNIEWSPAPCGGISNYNIYRRNGLYPDTIHCPCDYGAPSYTGYTLIGTTTDGIDTTFTDDNNGQGLTIGIEYCYIITAIYPNGSESCASPQTCATLKKDAPVITHADVRFTDAINGSVFVGWSKPTELDTIAYPPPYEYRVYHSPGFSGSTFSLIATFNSPSFFQMNDSSFIDTLIDTQSQPWSYKIEMYYDSFGVVAFKGQTAVASTIFLSIAPTDNKLNLSWEEHVPWTNGRYDVFKQNSSFTFDSIASVTTPAFSDTGLVNGTQYCYYIRSSGSYFFSGFIDPIINHSQRNCSVPVDNVHPCSPDLSVNSDCDNSLNQLVWTNPNNFCADDVLKYYIYFGGSENGNFELIDSVLSPTDTTYNHDELAMISGCYKVVAVDSVGNQTLVPEVVCVDTCRQYVIPSVFTPDGDFKNDFLHPCDSTTADDFQIKDCPPYKNVKSVEFKIYNRWGNLVFETTDKDINWDGKNKDSKVDCSEGVYFYTCKVFFFSVKEEQFKELNGTVQLLRQ